MLMWHRRSRRGASDGLSSKGFSGPDHRGTPGRAGHLPYALHSADAATSGFVRSVTRWSPDGPEPPPLVRLVVRALLRMQNAVTSGFALGLVSTIRVSRVFFSGSYQTCVRMRMQGMCGAMRSLSCGFAAVGELRRPGEVVLRVRA